MKVYRICAYLIAAEVLVQAAAIVLAVFGLGHWIDDGGVADKAAFEGDGPNFTGAVGFTIHGVNGTLLIPLLSLAFLIVSFFVKAVPGGIRWAATVLGLVALQVFLGLASHALVGLAPLHGLNAFALFIAALHAGRRVTRPAPAIQLEPAPV